MSLSEEQVNITWMKKKQVNDLEKGRNYLSNFVHVQAQG
jgi:hypothetical protein